MEAVTNYGVELDFGTHKEIAWWWGQPSGFWSWYHQINESYHPHLIAKRAIERDINDSRGFWETIRGEA